MPSSRVLVSLSTDTAFQPKETYNDVILFARSQTEPPGTITFNEQRYYTDPTQVAQDIGEDSDAHIASQALDAMGVREWRVIVVRENSATETLANSDTTAGVNSGTVSNVPMAGNFAATVTVDGSAVTEIPVAESPPNATRTPAADEALINYDTGEIVTGTASSGAAGAAGIQVTYHWLDWTSAFAPLDTTEIDIAALANVRAGAAYIGDLQEVVSWGSGDYVHVTAATENFATYPNEQAGLAAAQEVSTYLPSGDFSMTAHKSSGDVASYVAGLLATQKVWEDPSYHPSGFPGLAAERWLNPADMVGAPEQAGTIEGGSSQTGELHAGAMNALDYAEGSWVLSNSLTTLGHGSSYKYLDIRRTEGMVVTESRSALISLLKRERIPFNETGELLIENALGQTLRQYEYDRGPYSDLKIFVPPAEEVPQADRANRIWGVIPVQYRINGDVHRFRLDIRTTV